MLVATAAAVSGCARGGSSFEAGTNARSLLEPAYPAADLLVGPDWLRERLGDPNLVLLDLSDLPGYRNGHIPGATHFWWQDLIEIHNPVYGMLLGPESRREVIVKAGIGPEATVVCYDRSGGIYASRLIWVLRYMGFTNARLLSGGLQAWQAAGGALTNVATNRPSSAGIGDVRDESINANVDLILARSNDRDFAVLDSRTEAELDQTWRGQLRRGRIPGSFWLPRDRFLSDGPVRSAVSPDVLVERLAAAGIDSQQTAELVVYGLHATLASLPWLLLSALGGIHVRLYDGSWAEWGSREDLEIDTAFGGS